MITFRYTCRVKRPTWGIEIKDVYSYDLCMEVSAILCC